MLGFDKKEALKKNHHLTASGYYDRILFYNYLSSSRIRFNHNFSVWATINTCSMYGRGEGRHRTQTSSFFGLGCTLNTLMKNTKSLRDNSNSNIHLRLRSEKKIVCCLDNNQKGNKLKYQRFGKSNKFVKVTGSVIIQYNYCHPIIESVSSNVIITYVDQVFPSPYMMPHFEKLTHCDTDISIETSQLYAVLCDMKQTTKNNRKLEIYPSLENEQVDFTGKRVCAYMSILEILQSLNMMRICCGGMYCRTSNETKFVRYTPEHWKNQQIIQILRLASFAKKTLLNKQSLRFQNNVVLEWNRSSADIC